MAKQRTRPHVPLSTILMAVGCVVVVLVVAAIFYWVPRSAPSVTIPGNGPPYSGSNVEVQDYELEPSYWTNNTTDTSYLASQTCPDWICPMFVTPGASVLINLTLEDNDTISHQILSVDFDTPFSVVETLPTLPVTLTPHDPTEIQVEVKVPTDPAVYDASGTINTQ